MNITEPHYIWWSAGELASSGLPELPGTVQGINLLADRHGWKVQPGCAKRKAGRGGGWLYHWSVLPLAAQRKLLKDTAETPDERPDRGAAWTAFDSLPEAAKQKAKARLTALQTVDMIYATGVTKVVATDEAARQSGVSARSVYDWTRLVEGIAPEDRLAYLAPRNRMAARKNTKATCTLGFMEHLKSLFLRLERPSFSQCFRMSIAKAKAEGWDTLTEKTARRHFNAEVPRVTRVFAREGVIGLMRCFPAQIRDRASMAAMEGVNADCHKIDVFVRWPDGTINRPQIVGFQDLYSGKFLSWRVDNDPNKVMVMAAFGEMIEKYGIPKRCLFDNGHEFANKWMTAGTKTRFRFKVLEDDPLGVLPLMGIQVHWATPAHGQAKPVERAFRDFATNIAKDPRFHGAYVGNRPDAKPENYGSRAVPLETFIQVVEEGILEHNAREGRLSDTARGRSFDQTFADSYANAPIRKATEEQRRLWMMGQEVKKLNRQNGSVKLFGNVYHSPWMSQRASEKVVARFDPEDLHSGIHIYTANGGYLGFAECQQKVGFFDLVGAKEEARRKSRIKKAEKAVLNAHRVHSIEDLATDLNDRAPEAPDLVDSKVVTPEFHSSRRRMARITHAAPEVEQEVEATRQAMILSMDLHREKKPEPVHTAKSNMEHANEIQARSDAGKPVSKDEADWLIEFRNSPEYRTARLMLKSFGKDTAG